MSTKKSRLKRQEVLEEEVIENEETDEQKSMNKIYSPVIWAKYPPGFRIEDIRESDFPKVLAFVKNYFIDSNILTRNVNLSDETESESLNSFLHQTLIRLKDKCSICAVNEATKEYVGILIMRFLDEKDYGKVFSRVRFKDGAAYVKICNMENYLNRKTNVFSHFGVTKCLRYYLVATHPEFRKRGIGYQLLKTGETVARSMHIESIMGIFSSKSLQSKAKRLGMEVMHEIYYVDWVEDGEMVFHDPGPGNYTITIMASKVILLNVLNIKNVPVRIPQIGTYTNVNK